MIVTGKFRYFVNGSEVKSLEAFNYLTEVGNFEFHVSSHMIVALTLNS